MRETARTRRVGELLRRELAILIAREVDDRRVRMVSISGVDVSPDLKNARVFVNSAAPQADVNEIEQTLNRAAKYLRFLLGQNLKMRTTPALQFCYDHSIRRGMEMSALIDSLNAGSARGVH